MDFIPEPLNSHPPILVPLAANVIEYDFQDFATFPERSGFEQDRGSLAALTPHETARLVQSWLFFGILSQALGPSFHVEDFVSTTSEDPSENYLNLGSLKGLVKNASEIRDDDRASGICFAAKHAWKIINWMDKNRLLDLSPAAESGFAVLLLAQIVHQIWSPRDPWVASWDNSFLRCHLASNGWCPQKVDHLIKSTDVVFMWYVTRLKIPNPYELSHASCSTVRCVANNVNLGSTYQVRHERSNCGCNLAHVNEEKMRTIIRNGGVPLISVCENPDDSITLRVRKATARSIYFAVSHVWSDGLGNPTANALPTCQLRRLVRQISALPREVNSDQRSLGDLADALEFLTLGGLPPLPLGRWSFDSTRLAFRRHRSAVNQWFWIDTLCIPVGSSVGDTANLKQRAINQMAAIYAGAFQVLILDSAIQQARIGATTTCELLCKLAFSSWMRRCWTFQEGAVASRCYFQCLDGAANALYVGFDRDRFWKDRSPRNFTFNIKSNSLRTSLRRFILDHNMKWSSSDIANAPPFLRPAIERINALLVGAHLPRRVYSPLEDHIYKIAFGMFSESMQLLQRGAFAEGYSEGDAKRRGVWGTAGPVSQASHFCLVWNNLARRSTTMAEDVLAIMANVMDYSAYDILKLDPEFRLKAILCNMEFIPLSLLFNEGPKLTAERDRWIPSFPSPCLLEMAPLMRRKGDRLVLTAGYSGSTFLYLLDWSEDIASQFRIQLDHMEIMIELMRNTDENVITETGRVGLVFSKRPTMQESHCAMIVITKESWAADPPNQDLEPEEISDLAPPNLSLEGIYDCPARVRPVRKEEADQYRFLEGTTKKACWELSMACDNEEFKGKYQQRPHYSVLATGSWFAVLIFYVTISFIFFIVGFCIRLSIEVHMPWSARTDLAKASLVLFLLQIFPPLWPFLATPAIPLIMFAVDRRQTGSGFDPLAVAYIICTLVLNPLFALILSVLSYPIAANIAYRAWLQTFDAEWPKRSAGLLRLVQKFSRHWATVQRRFGGFGKGLPSWIRFDLGDPDHVAGVGYLEDQTKKLKRRAKMEEEMSFDPSVTTGRELVPTKERSRPRSMR